MAAVSALDSVSPTGLYPILPVRLFWHFFTACSWSQTSPPLSNRCFGCPPLEKMNPLPISLNTDISLSLFWFSPQAFHDDGLNRSWPACDAKTLSENWIFELLNLSKRPSRSMAQFVQWSGECTTHLSTSSTAQEGSNEARLGGYDRDSSIQPTLFRCSDQYHAASSVSFHVFGSKSTHKS